MLQYVRLIGRDLALKVTVVLIGTLHLAYTGKMVFVVEVHSVSSDMILVKLRLKKLKLLRRQPMRSLRRLVMMRRGKT